MRISVVNAYIKPCNDYRMYLIMDNAFFFHNIENILGIQEVSLC